MNIMTPIGLASADSAKQQCRAVSLELRELRAFISVARNGNFGRAARELELSQPTVSHQIQRLEEAVGQALLLRHGRGATLTPAGSALLERLDSLAHLLDAPLEPDSESKPSGTLCLGLPAELAPVLLPRLVEAVRAAWPALRLEVREANTAALEEAALTRRVDVAVLQDPPAFDSLDVTPVLSEPLGLVVGARSRLAQSSGPVRLRELAGMPLILADERHWIRRKLVGAAYQHGIRLNPALQIDSLASLKAMVRSGLGGAVLPRVAVQDELARGALVFRDIAAPGLACIHAVANSAAESAPAKAVAAQLRHVMAELVRSGAWSGGELVAPGETSRGATSHDGTDDDPVAGSRRAAAELVPA